MTLTGLPEYFPYMAYVSTFSEGHMEDPGMTKKEETSSVYGLLSDLNSNQKTTDLSSADYESEENRNG